MIEAEGRNRRIDCVVTIAWPKKYDEGVTHLIIQLQARNLSVTSGFEIGPPRPVANPHYQTGTFLGRRIRGR